MVFKSVLLFASLAVCANAGLTHLTPAVATYSSAPSVSYSHFTSPAIAATHTAIPVAGAVSYHAAAPLTTATVYNAGSPYSTYNAGPAIGTTHQSTVRSFDGTVSHQSKAVDTAFSSVRKSDTRVSNNVYAAAPALTTYAAVATAPAQTVSYHSAAPAAVSYHAAAPAQTVSYHAAAPVAQAVHYSPASVVSHVSFDGLGAHYVF